MEAVLAGMLPRFKNSDDLCCVWVSVSADPLDMQQNHCGSSGCLDDDSGFCHVTWLPDVGS